MPLLTANDIIASACQMVGANPLSEDGLGGDDPTAAAFEFAYNDVVDFNLGIYVFSFAREARQLSRNDNATPLTGYLYVYDLPAEKLGPPLQVTDNITSPKHKFTRYELVGEAVHSDAEALFARIRMRPDPHKWSPTFRSATVTALAARFALSELTDKDLSDRLTRRAYGSPDEHFRGGLIRTAINADAYSTPAETGNFDDNPLLAAWSDTEAGGWS